LSYPVLVLGDGYDHAHGDVCVDVCVDVGDCYQEKSLILNRKKIPRSMIHRISEVYGRCNKLGRKVSFPLFILR
jgi:hypothetical protein